MLAVYVGCVLVAAVAVTWFIAVGGESGVAVPVREGLRLSDATLGSSDLRSVRFTRSVRGYAPDEVDALLERLAAQFEERQRAEVSAGDSDDMA